MRDLIAGHPMLTASIEPLLNAREALALALERLDKLVRDQAHKRRGMSSFGDHFRRRILAERAVVALSWTPRSTGL